MTFSTICLVSLFFILVWAMIGLVLARTNAFSIVNVVHVYQFSNLEELGILLHMY